MQIVSVNKDRYLVLGTVSANQVTNPNTLKQKYYLSDTVLRNGDLFYICYKMIEAEFEELNQET